MTEQTAKARARQSAKTAPKSDPKIAEQAMREARIQAKRMPAQKLTANLSQEKKGEVELHPKETIVSEFDDPAGNMVRKDG